MSGLVDTCICGAPFSMLPDAHCCPLMEGAQLSARVGRLEPYEPSDPNVLLREWIELLDERIGFADKDPTAVMLGNLEAENLRSFLGALSTRGEL